MMGDLKMTTLGFCPSFSWYLSVLRVALKTPSLPFTGNRVLAPDGGNKLWLVLARTKKAISFLVDLLVIMVVVTDKMLITTFTSFCREENLLTSLR